MSPAGGRQARLDPIRHWWASHGARVLDVAIFCLSAYAVLKLGSEFGRLLFRTGPGPMDLHWFHVMVQRWASGRDVYVLDIAGPPAAYPPATFPLLYPLLGGLSLTSAAWLWAGLDALALAWLSITFIGHSGATTGRHRWFVGLWPLAANATGVTVGNGQTTLFLLQMLVGGALRLRTTPAWGHDLRIAALFVFALSKPNVAVPFFWLLLFVAPTVRPAALAVAGYALATVVGAAFQPSGLAAMLAQAATNGRWVAGRNGYLDVALSLHHLGLDALIVPVSAMVLAVLGVWVFRHRERDIWILLGVSAIVARLWTYHSVYDDVLILVAMVPLFRIATTEDGDIGVIAGLLVALNIVAMLALASWINTRTLMLWISVATHAVAWIATLVFLVVYARRERVLLSGLTVRSRYPL